MALPATDAFNQITGGNQGIATYGTWIVLEGGITIPNGNVGFYAGSSGGYNLARWNNDTFANDQYSIVTMKSSAWYGGPAVRCAESAATSYHVDCNNSQFYVSKDRNGTHTTIGSSPYTQSFVSGDKLKLEVTGSSPAVLKIYKALAATPTVFTLLATVNDSSLPIAAGRAGVFIYGNTSPSDGKGAWEGGEIGGGATSALPITLRARNFKRLIHF